MRPDESHTAWEGKLLAVTLERWGDNEREIVEHPGAVTIVAVDREDRVAFVRQFREATRKHLLELPAGTLEPGEVPLVTALRELEEETGLTGGDWREVTKFWTVPGFCRELMTLFFAEGVEAGEARPEADEELELVFWPVAEIEQLIAERFPQPDLPEMLQAIGPPHPPAQMTSAPQGDQHSPENACDQASLVRREGSDAVAT
jgi:ADP-ribose pyrophosphatase